MSPRSWIIRIQDMVRAIDSSQRILAEIELEEFKTDETRTLALMTCLTIVGEASNFIPDSIKQKYSEVPWTQLKGIRNRVTHEYFRIDEEILWNTCKASFPILKKQLERNLEIEQR